LRVKRNAVRAEALRQRVFSQAGQLSVASRTWGRYAAEVVPPDASAAAHAVRKCIDACEPRHYRVAPGRILGPRIAMSLAERHSPCGASGSRRETARRPRARPARVHALRLTR
jgi:hypothetical protein